MDTQTLLIVGVILVAVMVGLLMWNRRRPSGDADELGRLPRFSDGFGTALRKTWQSGLDGTTWDAIEETLLAADVGVVATNDIVSRLRSSRPETVEEARSLLSRSLLEEFEDGFRTLDLGPRPAVVLMVGVNGTGKTTTIAKLANKLKTDGSVVLLGAADTFRAAAGEQLEMWADRVGVEIVTGQEGGDPASVAFDAVEAGVAREADVIIIDTAGRLHGKKNLMGELKKIYRVSAENSGVDEVLLVLDATSGQNGLAQVREFADAVPLTGIVLTKLDGTAKGGIVIAVERELGVPIKFIGIGESLEDLEPFDPGSFVSALLEDS